MDKYLTKIQYIIKEEGYRVFLIRSFRYVSYVFFRAIFKSSVDSNKWLSIKDKYKGRKAFIIGNGPSLNKTPLYLLKNEFTICFNRFDLFFERLSWLPTAYSTIDDVVLDDIHSYADKITESTQYSFFPDLHPSAPVGKNFKNLLTKSDNIYWLHLSDLGFSSNLPKCGINKTVTNVAVQILAYMGFSEIYFVGVDLDYKIPSTLVNKNNREVEGGEDDDPNHFDPRYFGKGKKFHMPRMEETFSKFEEASLFLEDKDIKAFNAGVGGKLESFKRVNLNDLFDFSDIQQLNLMLGHLLPIYSSNLFDVFPNAVHIDDESDLESYPPEFITPLDLAIVLIPKMILKYIPFGPYNDQYLFLEREHKLLN